MVHSISRCLPVCIPCDTICKSSVRRQLHAAQKELHILLNKYKPSTGPMCPSLIGEH